MWVRGRVNKRTGACRRGRRVRGRKGCWIKRSHGMGRKKGY